MRTIKDLHVYEILLDSQSTMGLLTNKTPLKNFCDAKKPLSLQFNYGMTTVNKIIVLMLNVTVWFYKDGMAKILSMC